MNYLLALCFPKGTSKFLKNLRIFASQSTLVYFRSYNRKDYGCYPKAFVFGENNIPKQFETVPFTKP